MPQTISKPSNRHRHRFKLSLFRRKAELTNGATSHSRQLPQSVETELMNGNMIDLDRHNYDAVIHDFRRDVIVEYYEPGVTSHLSRR